MQLIKYVMQAVCFLGDVDEVGMQVLRTLIILPAKLCNAVDGVCDTACRQYASYMVLMKYVMKVLAGSSF